MHKKSMIAASLSALIICLAACKGPAAPADSLPIIPTQGQPASSATIPLDTTVPETTAPTLPPETKPPHSPLYIEGLDVEDVIKYFNEVSLDAEFANSGNAKLVQKWMEPICYRLHGAPTDKDLEVLNTFATWLNTIDGFPGISEAKDTQIANLQIHFCTEKEMISLMGEQFAGNDGAVTFWYWDNVIGDAIICYRTDLNQYVRNSVILEEIYNGLGPIQDTQLRTDSIIYSGYSEPQQLTHIDELILKLLYHPDIKCGMDASECEAVIRQLYY